MNAKYQQLRDLALQAKASDLGLEGIAVYGMVMDWPISKGIGPFGKAAATLVAFRTQEASLYWSSGGGVIGGGQHESVRAVVRRLFEVIDSGHIEAAYEDGAFEGFEYVKFIFLTSAGKAAIKAKVKELMTPSSPLHAVWMVSQELIGAIRVISDGPGG